MNVLTTLWYLILSGFAINYMIRITINIAIVSMVRPPKITPSKIGAMECFNSTEIWRNETTRKTTRNVEELFDWDEYQQTQVLGAFYWLHWLTELPGGIIAHHYGTKQVFGLGNFIPILLTILTPMAAYYNYSALIAIRVLVGFISGVAWPSMHVMLAKWVPPQDRSKFTSAYLGSSLGVCITYFMCGFIIDYFGWENVFYVTGAIGIVWYIAWCFLVYEAPDDHPWISNEEKMYIITSIGDSKHKEKLPVPWTKIMASGPLWLTIFVQWACIWSLITLMTHTPTYLKIIHGLDIKMTGMLSALPHLTRFLFAFVFALFCDYMIRKNIMGTTNVRKLATALCTVVQSIFLLCLAFSGCDTTAAMISMVVAVTLQGAVSSGSLASFIDLAPNFASILQGLSGMIGITAGFISPILVGLLTKNNQTITQWQKVFYIATGLVSVSGVIYLIFGNSELQEWNSGDKKETEEGEPLRDTNEKKVPIN